MLIKKCLKPENATEEHQILIKECLKLENAAEEHRSIPMLQFVETSCSLLQQMPWITVIEHKVRMNS